jgi:hypothetical protein
MVFAVGIHRLIWPVELSQVEVTLTPELKM